MDLDHLNLRVDDAAMCRAFYERHFGFALAFEAEDGFFLRNDGGFLLALVPAARPHRLPDGFHIGFGQARADDVTALHGHLTDADERVTTIEDHRPGDDYVTFRCWDPDGTEIEIFWDGDRPRP